ncbi:MAG: Plug domain-containing protein [Gemmatimonadota bacterium]|nr:Plug domain-containing protein [Gemmatimonadota bacterium]
MNRFFRCAGLGLLVGAVLPCAARAQQRDTLAKRDSVHRADSLARRDTVPRDTLAKRDTLAASDTTPKVPLPVDTMKAKADTLKAPLAHAQQPRVADSTGTYHLDRDQLFATGARDVADLLARLPGVTTLSTGWMAAPNTAVYLGDAARVRVFLDGLEYTTLDPHAGGSIDYAQIPLWPIEAVTVERSPSEVRVYLNTWRVDRTTPYTRTDISTGDYQTNQYRGFFGRRFKHGEALQFGVQQYGTAPTRGGATSDQLSFMGRLGWARGKFSVDAFLLQVGSHRGLIRDPVSGDSLAKLQATRRDAYLRVGYGDPDAGPWLQAMAATTRDAFAGGAAPAASTDSTAARGDTVNSASQYVLAGGLSKWGFRLSATGRYFGSFDRGPAPGDTAVTVITPGKDSTPPDTTIRQPKHRHGIFVPELRAGYHWWRFGFSAYTQGKGLDSTSRSEVNAVFTPFSFLRFAGAVGSARDARQDSSALSPAYRRVEAGLRLHDFWIGGGLITRGAAQLAAPTLVNDSLVRATEPSATAKFVTVQGRVWKGIHADVYALRWDDSTGLYRPQYQTRSQLYISTSLLDRFPNNSFHFFLGLTHEYRSATYFPLGDAGVERMPGYRTVGAQLEIRIERAVLSYRFTNALGEKYMQVPGFLMPRQTSIYGVRWEFWN